MRPLSIISSLLNSLESMHCHSIRLVWFQFALSRFHAHALESIRYPNKIWKVNYINYRLLQCSVIPANSMKSDKSPRVIFFHFSFGFNCRFTDLRKDDRWRLTLERWSINYRSEQIKVTTRTTHNWPFSSCTVHLCFSDFPTRCQNWHQLKKVSSTAIIFNAHSSTFV